MIVIFALTLLSRSFLVVLGYTHLALDAILEIKLTNLVSMFANQDFCDISFKTFDPTASATTKGQNCGYGPTLNVNPTIFRPSVFHLFFG